MVTGNKPGGSPSSGGGSDSPGGGAGGGAGGGGDFSPDNAVFDSEALNQGVLGFDNIGTEIRGLNLSIKDLVAQYKSSFGDDDTGQTLHKNVDQLMTSITGGLQEMSGIYERVARQLEQQLMLGQQAEDDGVEASNQLAEQFDNPGT